MTRRLIWTGAKHRNGLERPYIKRVAPAPQTAKDVLFAMCFARVQVVEGQGLHELEKAATGRPCRKMFSLPPRKNHEQEHDAENPQLEEPYRIPLGGDLEYNPDFQVPCSNGISFCRLRLSDIGLLLRSLNARTRCSSSRLRTLAALLCSRPCVFLRSWRNNKSESANWPSFLSHEKPATNSEDRSCLR